MRRLLAALAPLALVSCVGDLPAGSDGGRTGELDGPCFDNATCNAGLVCVAPNKCVMPEAGTGADAGDGASDAVDDLGPPACSLVSWWRGDNTPDDKNGKFPLMWGDGGTASYAAGYAGSGFSLDGTGDYLEGFNSTLPPPTSVTVEGWIIPMSVSTGTIFSTKDLWFGLTNSQLSASVSNVVCKGVATLAINNRYHVAATWDNTKIKLFVDGTLDNSCDSINGPYAVLNLSVGARFANKTYFFNGVIDELALWDRALSENEITDLKSQPANNMKKCP